MARLQDLLAEPGMRPRVIDDCVVVLQEEVSKKKGVKGLLIKGGFKVISKLDGGRSLHKMIDFLLDEFVEALEPFNEQYNELDEASRPSFRDYLIQNSEDVTQALLGVTDNRRAKARNKILIKTYDKLRPVAESNVRDGVPAVGRVIQNFAYSK